MTRRKNMNKSFDQDISNWDISKLSSNLDNWNFPNGFPDNKKPTKTTS